MPFVYLGYLTAFSFKVYLLPGKEYNSVFTDGEFYSWGEFYRIESSA